MELIIDEIDVFNPTNGKIDAIIDAFVEFYGEKYRKTVTEKIKNNHFIFVPKNTFEPINNDIFWYFNKPYSDVFIALMSHFTTNKKQIK